jgi:hypothetical protein
VAQPIYEKLRKDTPGNYYLVADTAFPRGTDQISGRIKAPIKAGQRLPANPIERDKLLAFDRQLLSFRQTAEWGMRALQGSFGRLRMPLDINFSEQRQDLLEACVRLNNVRARMVGINQIRSVYMPIWQEDEHDRMVWEQFEKMLFSHQRNNDRVARFHLSST